MRIHIHCLDHPLIEGANAPSRRRIGGTDGPIIATVFGDLDTPALPTFRHRIERAVADAESRTLIVDLSHLDFLSISAVQALADIQDHICREGMAMLLVAPPASRTLTATGMANHFHIHTSVRAAVEARRNALTAHLGLSRSRTHPHAG